MLMGKIAADEEHRRYCKVISNTDIRQETQTSSKYINFNMYDDLQKIAVKTNEIYIESK